MSLGDGFLDSKGAVDGSDGRPQTGTKPETADTAKGRPARHRAGPRPDQDRQAPHITIQESY